MKKLELFMFCAVCFQDAVVSHYFFIRDEK